MADEEIVIACKPPSRAATYEELMNWDPKKEYAEALKLAKGALSADDLSLGREAELARHVQKLVAHIVSDEEAIAATLKECGGHATLAVLIVYYQAHKKSHDELKAVKALAAKMLKDYPDEKPVGVGEYIEEARSVFRRIAGERKI